MPYAKLQITIPDAVWISDVSRSHPETTFRVLAATANDATGVARIEIRGDNPDPVCEEIRGYDSVIDLTVFDAEPRMASVQIETSDPLLLTSIQAAGVPLEMPFDVRDGEMTLEVTIPQHALSELGETFDRFGIGYTVDRIQPDVNSDELLTERQEWVLDEALERGYYDTPRRTSLVALADDLGIAKSTCSEILHRAEERVMKRYGREGQEAQTGIRSGV